MNRQLRHFGNFGRVCFATTMFFIAGCGYTWSNDGGNFSADSTTDSKGLYRHDVKTVAVPIFANRTYYRNVEFSLTKSIINQLESRTPYKVAPKEEADTILEGEITDVGVHLQNRYAFNGLPQEQLFYMVVNFTWKDLRTGKILADRRQFNQSSPYYPTLGEDQFLGSQENVERLGLAIVEELQRDWADVKTPTTKP
jgi:hypothetical protein